MSLILENGDYVPDGAGGVRRDETLISEVLFRLTCRRGAFCLMPELGSRLHLLGREKPSARDAAARDMAQQALSGLGVTVEKATVKTDGDKARVTVVIRTAQEETVEVTV